MLEGHIARAGFRDSRTVFGCSDGDEMPPVELPDWDALRVDHVAFDHAESRVIAAQDW